MDEKNKVFLTASIVAAIIGAMGITGAALITNFDKIFPQDKPTSPPLHVKPFDTTQKSSTSVLMPKQEIIISTVPAQSEGSQSAKNFDKSDFLFENKKFIEDKPELFSNGRISLSVRKSSDYECTVRISQLFKGKNEKEYELIKGSPFEVSVGGANYILHFTDGVYREYCIISSYVTF